MTPRQKRLLSTVLLIAACTVLPVGMSLAANKPSKPAAMLGSHPTKEAKAARLALLKQRTSAVPLKSLHSLHPPRTANSLIHRPGRTITVPRKAPK
jgi:hypothetical protein